MMWLLTDRLAVTFRLLTFLLCRRLSLSVHLFVTRLLWTRLRTEPWHPNWRIFFSLGLSTPLRFSQPDFVRCSSRNSLSFWICSKRATPVHDSGFCSWTSGD